MKAAGINTVRREIPIIFLLYSLANFLFLIHNGIVVDDWYNNLIGDDAIIYHNLAGGRPWFGYAALPIFPLDDIFSGTAVYLHRIFVFTFFFISAVLFNRILARIEEITPHARFVMTLFFATLPYFNAKIFVSMWLYPFCYMIFFLAFYLLPYRQNAAVRLLSLLLFSLSFLVQSFLAFFGLVFIYFLYEKKEEAFEIYKNRKFRPGFVEIGWKIIRRQPDYFFLPFIIWFLQRTFYPPFGEYSSYNAITAHTLLKAPLVMLVTFFNTPFETVVVPLKYLINGSGLTVLAAALLSGLIYFAVHKLGGNKWKEGKGSTDSVFILFGLFAFFLAIFPYAVAGKAVPSLLSWANKNYLLMPAGMSFLLYYGLSRFTALLKPSARRIVMATACSILPALFIVYSATYWIEYNIAWFKQLALVENYRQSQTVRENDIFLMVDTTTDLNAMDRANFLFYEYMGPLNIAYPGMVKFAAHADTYKRLQAGKTRLHERFTAGGFGYEGSNYYLKDFSLNKPVYYLVIKKGSLKVAGLRDVIDLKLLQFSDEKSFKAKILKFISIETIKLEEWKNSKWKDFNIPQPELSILEKLKRKVTSSS